MHNHRKLALRREVLAELPATELRRVAAAYDTRICASAYTVVSCWITDCLLSDEKTICLEG